MIVSIFTVVGEIFLYAGALMIVLTPIAGIIKWVRDKDVEEGVLMMAFLGIVAMGAVMVGAVLYTRLSR